MKGIVSKRMLVMGSVFGVLCIFTSCVTQIPVSYTEPAKLNLGGVKLIGIQSNDPQVESFISQRLSASGAYTVISAAPTQELMQLKNRQATALEVPASNLVAEYKANAVRADNSYKGKLLKTSGTIKEIGHSSKGRYFVRLAVGNDSVDIFFASSEVNKVGWLNNGETITIFGICTGFSLPDMDDTAEILRILGGGQQVNITEATFPVVVDGVADAIITLSKKTDVQDSQRIQREQAKDGEGNVIKDTEGKTVQLDVPIYTRNVTVTIDYSIRRVQDNSSLGQGTKTAKSPTSSDRDRSKLTSVSDLERRTIEKPLQELASDIVPTKRTMNLTLAKPDNNEAKKEMGEAEKLAKAKDYKGAATAYGKIYAQYENFAAGYNQALLTEAADGTEAAIGLMTALSQKFNNSDAQKMLGEMQRRNAMNQRSVQQLNR